MSHATALTVCLQGASGFLVDVQTDLSQGLVSTALVGRPDASVTEARDRCRAAVINSGFDWPTTKRITILLSPADLRKSGSHLDLAIAMSVLGANGVVPARGLADTVFIGELTLDGRLRAVAGVLPMVLCAQARGARRVVVPEVHAGEAALVQGMEVLGARSLAQVAAALAGKPIPDAAPVEPLPLGPGIAWRGEERMASLDLGDLVGMADTRYALEVAAAGGHHLMFSGPKGSGKTTLAERLPSILPDLSTDQALEVTAIQSLANTLPGGAGIARRPPFQAPHHSATRASLLGGGSGRTRPGAISQALHGTLFLDEFPLFASDIIEALRQPLESGEITIARGEEIATYPARTMFVLACNPCPCGEWHALNRDNACQCTELQRRRYRSKLSGPLVDRIDITRHVEPARPYEWLDPLASAESSEEVRRRVERARVLQAERYQGTPWRLNGDVPGPALNERWGLDRSGRHEVEQHVVSGRLTRRGMTRVHRLAWTVADLRGLPGPDLACVQVALRLRLGEPLVVPGADRRPLEPTASRV